MSTEETKVEKDLVNNSVALTGVAQWVGHHPTKPKVTVSVLVKAHAWAGGVQEATDSSSHASMFLSLSSPSLPLFLKVHK